MYDEYDDRQPQPDGPFGAPGGPFGGPGGPFGTPGGPSGGPGFGPSGGAPSGPPPSFTPQMAQAQSLAGGPALFALDPGAVRPCRFRFVYIWLDNGQQFWAWITFVGRRSVAGFRWIGFRWVYFAVDINRITFFQCF